MPDLDIVTYSELTDTTPQPRRTAWEALAAKLLEHEERAEKDGPGWSATVYRPEMTRGKAGVMEVTALVFDVDHAEPLWSLLDGLEYAAHTTWKHYASSEHVDCGGRADCPHWRVVLPLAVPVPVADWDSVRQRARFWLCPNADESAKDAPRFFWLPTCQPGMPHDVRRSRGRWLDPGALRAVPAAVESARVVSVAHGPVSGAGERPGDRYEREADWCRDLLPAWTPVGIHGDNLMLRRPGSTNAYGATISRQGQGVLYVFTDGAAPLEPNTCYSKFGCFAVLEHGGDFRAAARALAERYGMPARRNGLSVGRIGMETGDEAESVEDSTPEKRPLTETGNAERLVDRYGQDIRFCHPWGQWLCWDGRRWGRDQSATVEAWAKVVIRSIYDEIAEAQDKKERELIFRHALKSETSGARSAMLRLAQSETGIPILPEDMDCDHFLLTVLNGTIDLRTGQIRPHDQRDVITKLAPVAFDTDATCPTFLRFLEQVLPDEGVRIFMQRYVGYSLTSDTSAQCLAFLYGSGANGKSTLLTLIRTLLGDYAKHAAPDLLMQRQNDRHTTELADLFGARLVTSVEVDEGKRLAEVLIKQMTGGDPMKGRFLFKDFFEWMPTHKLLLAANHKPEIRGTDHAIWRRIHLVPFTVTIPLGERDEALPAKLLAEGAGILQWALRGCLDWQQDGLRVPDTVRAATEGYRQEQDILARFLESATIRDPQAWVTAAALYGAYLAWCKKENEAAITQTAFGRRMGEYGYASDKGSKGARVWRGLRLTRTDEW